MVTRKTIPGFSPTRSGQQERESVLVVDDDIRVIELLQITLTGRGYTVSSAFDGEAALEEIQRRLPDLLVLDVRLPRKSGFQVLDALRTTEATRHLPVILISGNPSNEARIQGLRMGADDYLIKPFSPRELIMKIRRILDRAADQKLLRRRAVALECEVQQQREQMLQAQTEMHRNLLKIGTVLQRVDLISEHRSLQEVFDGFARAVISDVGIAAVCIFARERRDAPFAPEVWRGIPDGAALNLTLPGDSFICEVMAMEGRTMVLDEFADYPRAAEELQRLSTAGFTHVTPIHLDDEVVAMIAGADKSDGQPLDQIDIHLLAVLARSAATSMRNAGVFDEVQKSFVETTAQLVATVEARYPNVAGHSARVHDLALRLAEAAALPLQVRQTVSFAARLHDLGALEEYESLFGGEQVLDDRQRAALRARTSQGVRRILERAQMPAVAEAVCHLNEYWDGSGLPAGLVGEAIPIAARVVAVANAFDALIHARPHRPAYSAEDALSIIRNRAGHQFDPNLAAAFGRQVVGLPDMAGGVG